jgi:phage FluMu protein Com
LCHWPHNERFRTVAVTFLFYIVFKCPTHPGCKDLNNLKKEELDFEIGELCAFMGMQKNKVKIGMTMHPPLHVFRYRKNEGRIVGN